MYLGALMFEWLRLLMSEHNMIITDVRLTPITNLKYSRHLPKGMGFTCQFIKTLWDFPNKSGGRYIAAKNCIKPCQNPPTNN